jgi:hypothetical protein
MKNEPLVSRFTGGFLFKLLFFIYLYKNNINMKKKNFIQSILASKGAMSSKRLVTLLAFALMGVAFLSNLYFDFKIDEFLYESMKWIVVAGLGFTASEALTKKDKNKSEDENK